MKKLFCSTISIFIFIALFAQQPFKGHLRNNEMNLNLYIDLYEESVMVPQMDMFGPQYGYMNGDVYRLWIITSAKVDGKTATIS